MHAFRFRLLKGPGHFHVPSPKEVPLGYAFIKGMLEALKTTYVVPGLIASAFHKSDSYVVG
jgi:hypothetical protein